MPRLELHTPLRFVRGVGPFYSRQFREAGIKTVMDLLCFSPARYLTLPAHKPIAQWQAGQTACIAGEIASVRLRGGRSKPGVTARVIDGDESCRITWFNTPYLKSKLAAGMFICATGKIQQGEGGAQMNNPQFELYDHHDKVVLPDSLRFQAVYAAVGKVNSTAVKRIVQNCLSGVHWPEDYLPGELREKRSLIRLDIALRHIHQPDSLEAAGRARRRLAYDELLFWQLEFARSRQRRQQLRKATPLPVTPEIDRRIRKRFPFELTKSQDQAVREICADLIAAKPMLRLLQGDVGCGKTAVAVFAALVAIANKQQVALLAPTEPLVQQHYSKIRQYLEGSKVRTALASGSLSASAREQVRGALQNGEVDFVVGTHALLEPGVKFQRLGLVIIDEQHRFGVHQRQTLKSKGRSLHYLVLSATPIPRTQALALVGDLDVSIIQHMPTGKRRIKTRIVAACDVHRAWGRLRSELDQGRQAYIVLPLVEESEKLPLKSVLSEFERLKDAELKGYRCAFLHGRMKAKLKQEVVDRFRCGDVQVLVTTTVIEVGIDIPNATVMAVFHAERYGLAQLHQLRGRIGRAGDQAHFLMFADHQNEKVRQRLGILEQTTDGFKIAEADMRLRGPGEILGTLQHGLPKYKFANLGVDMDLLSAAQQDAQAITQGRIKFVAGDGGLPDQLNPLRRNDSRLIHVA